MEGLPPGTWRIPEKLLSQLSPGYESFTHMKVLVGDFHGIGHAGLFLGLHQAAPQGDDTLRKNQNRQLSPRPAQVIQGLWEPLAKARSC